MIDFVKKHKVETISVAIFIIVIVFSCIYNFGMPQNESRTEDVKSEVLEETKNEEQILTKTDEPAKAEEKKPEPKQEEKQEATDILEEDTCSLTVSCATILDNIDDLKSGKEDLIPSNGIIFTMEKVKFNDGDTAFDLLLREVKEKDIDIEYKQTQFSAGCYIESIGGIGEFDCGKTSGWLYKVNGEMPNVAASNYILKNGDKVEFLYSCKMGDI